MAAVATAPATADLTRVHALAERLRAAAAVYLDDVPPSSGDDAQDAGLLLELMVERVARTGDSAGAWLTWTAAAAFFPTAEEVRHTLRVLELATPTAGALWLLRQARPSARNRESLDLGMDVVVGQVLASVDYCARVEHHTGIQRVVRETLPRWDRDHHVLPVAWTDEGTIMRDLDDVETDRVLRWNDQVHVGRTSDPGRRHRLVVPWRSCVVLIEVPLPQLHASLRGLAQYSGNDVTAVGYDAIPVVSADIRPYGEPDNFVQYLSIVKHASRISGISVSAAQEFRGFAEALPSQGLPSPVVTEAFLPGEAPHATTTADAAPGRPLVLSVGSQEQHKNHLALLHAAERLWREGIDFELQFIGRAGWNSERLEARARQLADAGRPVAFRRGVFDEELWDSYRRSRFSVFASLHEGYGLPVAESLACGTPVITTDYGSTREIAEGGGCLLVDPRHDDQLADAMRSLLTDDELWHKLSQAARDRPVRLWDDYATELWDQLIGPRDAT